mmetsp:Transcript_4078/g.4663  ORF Transcript_4078/g.4663 Transcript_4078/m.4663 type:complete len:104 (-) Transcript_4078:595-906(-)|eukprot:CAMPEP_0197848902 /NCGR_PEP_ID=MMETSP1438-20131217/10433_1 /TAXON_ID=1461541 /ORGANISM="Pterosperma sp., Strain CCMP1384" /LENGTH=103 /DNA_ID=CAMNT_0043461365 /DNA_START=224 /DNA_END=535 /DNA_ORIENTATION=+
MPLVPPMHNGDPRVPTAARKFVRPVLKDDDLPSDMMAIVSFGFGLAASMAKVKMAGWGAIMTTLSAIANQRWHECDIKQLIVSSMFAFMGLFTCYKDSYFAPK